MCSRIGRPAWARERKMTAESLPGWGPRGKHYCQICVFPLRTATRRERDCHLKEEHGLSIAAVAIFDEPFFGTNRSTTSSAGSCRNWRAIQLAGAQKPVGGGNLPAYLLGAAHNFFFFSSIIIGVNRYLMIACERLAESTHTCFRPNGNSLKMMMMASSRKKKKKNKTLGGLWVGRRESLTPIVRRAKVTARLLGAH